MSKRCRSARLPGRVVVGIGERVWHGKPLSPLLEAAGERLLGP
jgi:hypothetical protein